MSRWAGTFTLNKLECLKQAKISPEYSVHGIIEEDLGSILLVFGTDEVMINRNGWGHSYCDVRGEILGSSQDGQKRKHLPKTLSLIKNES